MRRNTIIKNYVPPYGTTKTVMLTLKERKAIGRRKLAWFVANKLACDGATSVIKMRGCFYRFSFGRFEGKDDVFRVHVNGRSKFHVLTFDDFVDYLYMSFDECSLRRIEKIRVQRVNDRHSLEGGKKLYIHMLVFT